MNELKHTPGPWEAVQNNPDSDLTYTIMAANQPIADVYESGTAEHNQESEDTHNARLIAAAPELLAACKGAIAELNTYWKGDYAGRPLASELRAAIAKAEGR
jgi:hypothetical protein